MTDAKDLPADSLLLPAAAFVDFRFVLFTVVGSNGVLGVIPGPI